MSITENEVEARASFGKDISLQKSCTLVGILDLQATLRHRAKQVPYSKVRWGKDSWMQRYQVLWAQHKQTGYQQEVVSPVPTHKAGQPSHGPLLWSYRTATGTVTSNTYPQALCKVSLHLVEIAAFLTSVHDDITDYQSRLL